MIEGKIEMTFGMIKPEGIERHLVDDIIQRIERKGLEIREIKEYMLNRDEVDAMYGHVEKRIPEIYQKTKLYLTTNNVMLLKISGKDAIRTLLRLRGASNAAEAEPGTIRGDYARDQNYAITKRENRIALNVFHAAGSKEEADDMLNLLFGGEIS